MKKLLFIAPIMMLASSMSYAQVTSVPTTTLNLAVGSEAVIVVGSTNAFSTSSTFAPYTATTPFTYYIRTSASGGSGTITLKITSDFSPSGGPSVASPPNTGDALTYANTISAPGTAAGGQTAATTGGTPVASFGAAAYSAIAGNTGSVAWSLTNDPKYASGSYAATATFTISAT